MRFTHQIDFPSTVPRVPWRRCIRFNKWGAESFHSSFACFKCRSLGGSENFAPVHCNVSSIKLMKLRRRLYGKQCGGKFNSRGAFKDILWKRLKATWSFPLHAKSLDCYLVVNEIIENVRKLMKFFSLAYIRWFIMPRGSIRMSFNALQWKF